MGGEPKITRVYRVKESFIANGATFHQGELILETHPAVKEYPNLFELAVLDLESLIQPPAHLLQRARRVYVPETPPSWWSAINGGAA
jgi:hypothetical protein